eukprot:TRINITY_DN2199_c0_g2_i1.p1 TRINITY_DN2199_c0_g2~~TRINITY_DN2199_c0_g2_i1.p1  ORF type:complete len:681 (+),score=121.26 TRINITY_DN2199_c0_g2_i1:230-2272(+)
MMRHYPLGPPRGSAGAGFWYQDGAGHSLQYRGDYRGQASASDEGSIGDESDDDDSEGPSDSVRSALSVPDEPPVYGMHVTRGSLSEDYVEFLRGSSVSSRGGSVGSGSRPSSPPEHPMPRFRELGLADSELSDDPADYLSQEGDDETPRDSESDGELSNVSPAEDEDVDEDYDEVPNPPELQTVEEERLQEVWPLGDASFSIFLCPVTHDVMRDPVVSADGYTYERAAIARWFETSRKSPVTGQTLPHTELVPNHSVRTLLKTLIDMTAPPVPASPAAQQAAAVESSASGSTGTFASASTSEAATASRSGGGLVARGEASARSNSPAARVFAALERAAAARAAAVAASAVDSAAAAATSSASSSPAPISAVPQSLHGGQYAALEASPSSRLERAGDGGDLAALQSRLAEVQASLTSAVEVCDGGLSRLAASEASDGGRLRSQSMTLSRTHPDASAAGASQAFPQSFTDSQIRPSSQPQAQGAGSSSSSTYPPQRAPRRRSLPGQETPGGSESAGGGALTGRSGADIPLGAGAHPSAAPSLQAAALQEPSPRLPSLRPSPPAGAGGGAAASGSAAVPGTLTSAAVAFGHERGAAEASYLGAAPQQPRAAPSLGSSAAIAAASPGVAAAAPLLSGEGSSRSHHGSGPSASSACGRNTMSDLPPAPQFPPPVAPFEGRPSRTR